MGVVEIFKKEMKYMMICFSIEKNWIFLFFIRFFAFFPRKFQFSFVLAAVVLDLELGNSWKWKSEILYFVKVDLKKTMIQKATDFSNIYFLCTFQNTPIRLGQDSYICPFCSTIMKSWKNLEIHIRIHTGEKPFSCSYCTYAANHKSNLDRHIKNVHK